MNAIDAYTLAEKFNSRSQSDIINADIEEAASKGNYGIETRLLSFKEASELKADLQSRGFLVNKLEAPFSEKSYTLIITWRTEALKKLYESGHV